VTYHTPRAEYRDYVIRIPEYDGVCASSCSAQVRAIRINLNKEMYRTYYQTVRVLPPWKLALGNSDGTPCAQADSKACVTIPPVSDATNVLWVFTDDPDAGEANLEFRDGRNSSGSVQCP
jgi:hypothetical protein